MLTAATVFWFATRAASATVPEPIVAIPANDFLNSIGTLSAISVRGENLEKTIECTRYLGVRWFRSGIEGNVPMQQFVDLHRQVGLRCSWGFGSGSSDLGKLIRTGKELAQAGALLAFEGPNEPNNWAITYQGEKGGGGHGSWAAVAKLQRDLYQAVKEDPLLKQYPVWSISEGGAETDNVGLQFLKIPSGAGTILPEGTAYADFANVHNYIYHPNASGLEDNKTWKAADPGPACKVDGLYVEYGVTWAHHYRGYGPVELAKLPRVTTETGTTIGGAVTEKIHGLNLLSMYLDQFKRGWSYTCVYLLRDRGDEGGNQKFGFYAPDYTPRKAAVYLHNLTSILADTGSIKRPGKIAYSIQDEPETVHDLLMQKSSGAFELVVWDERLNDADKLQIWFGKPHEGVKLYDPTVGTMAIQQDLEGKTLSLVVSNHPVVVEIAQ